MPRNLPESGETPGRTGAPPDCAGLPEGTGYANLSGNCFTIASASADEIIPM